MKTRIFNAKILTMEKPLNVFDGEVWIEDDRIISVINSSEISSEKTATVFDEEIDAKGNLIMPGFKNAHTHTGMTFLRSKADDEPLASWLNEQIFPREAKLTGDDIYHFTKLGILEYLQSGITAAMEMYLTPETIAAAFDDMGMRCVQVGSMNNFSQSLELQEKWFNSLNKEDSLTSYSFGFHAEYTCSKELLEGMAELSKKYNAPVFCHNSETRGEVEGCIAKYGMTPTELMDSLGIYDNGGGGYHCVYMSDKDIEIFKKRGLYVVTNPASNMKLASGVAPLTKYQDNNIPVAIGTDGPASNNCLDMFREMFLATALQKLVNEDASALDANEVLYMATVNGAKAMGLNDCDILARGKKADLIMIDLSQPNMQPLNNITKNIVYSCSKTNIKMTMINGKILYRDNEFLFADSEEIYSKAAMLSERIG